MELSHPAVHPVAVPPAHTEPPARVRMKDYQGMPGTLGGVALRLGQLGFAVLSFSIMVSTPDFAQVTAFWYISHSHFMCKFVILNSLYILRPMLVPTLGLMIYLLCSFWRLCRNRIVLGSRSYSFTFY